MPENIAALGTESEIGIIEYRTPAHLIVRCAPILLVEHIRVDDKGLRDDVIRTVGDGITILFIRDILARPEYQRKGIGKGLLQAMLKRYSDVRQTELLTDDGSYAVKFYGAMGFEKAKRMGCCAFVKFN